MHEQAVRSSLRRHAISRRAGRRHASNRILGRDALEKQSREQVRFHRDAHKSLIILMGFLASFHLPSRISSPRLAIE